MKNSIMKKVTSIIFLLSAVFMLSGCTKDTASYEMDLEMWGVFDDSDVFNDIFRSYNTINPFVNGLTYRKFVVEDYKKDLIDALASDTAPDIFYIHNTWLPEFQDRIAPAPASVLGEAEFRANFPDGAVEDAVREGQIYAVPLTMDSLALYYNKDLFNFEAITVPPTTWEEFNDVSRRLTKVGTQNQIIQAGSAFGTATNINRSTDIVQALMFQSGATVSGEGLLSFESQGENVLNYYTQFARVGSAFYTWNTRMHYSLDAFSEGTVGMMVNYSWHYDTIKRKNSNLNIAVAPLPQPETGMKANYANYWMLAVAKTKLDAESSDPQKKNEVRVMEAWELLRFLAINNNGRITLTNGLSGNTQEFAVNVDPTSMYLEETGKPAARRDLIEQQKSDPFLRPFVTGNLIARSWAQPDSGAVETIIADAVDGMNTGRIDTRGAVQRIQNRVRALMK